MIVGAVVLAVVWAALTFPLTPCVDGSTARHFSCHDHDIETALLIWLLLIISTGSVAALIREALFLRTGKRTIGGAIGRYLGVGVLLAASILPLTFGAVRVGEHFGLGLFSGDAGFAILLILFLAAAWVVGTTLVAAAVFFIVRKQGNTT